MARFACARLSVLKSVDRSYDTEEFWPSAEGRFSPLKSKTANGAIAYLPGEVVGVVDSTKAGMTAQQVLGYGGDIPVLRNLEEGLHLRSDTYVDWHRARRGTVAGMWRDLIRQSIKANLHILSGLHTILSDD